MTKIVVMKVHMKCEKCRTKALMVASQGYGVTSVRLAGEDQERVIVEGERLNAADLANSLGKKVGYTQILTVTEVLDI